MGRTDTPRAAPGAPGDGFVPSGRAVLVGIAKYDADFGIEPDRSLTRAQPGSGKSAFLAALLQFLSWSGTATPAQTLRIGTSTIEIKSDAADRPPREAGARLLVISVDSAASVLHPPSATERHIGLEGTNLPRHPRAGAIAAPSRLVQRATALLRRQLQSAERLTFASLWRRLIRAAVSILKQLLRLQRRRLADTPVAQTHSHDIDQHRSCGPNRHWITSPLVVIWEPAQA